MIRFIPTVALLCAILHAGPIQNFAGKQPDPLPHPTQGLIPNWGNLFIFGDPELGHCGRSLVQPTLPNGDPDWGARPVWFENTIPCEDPRGFGRVFEHEDHYVPRGEDPHGVPEPASLVLMLCGIAGMLAAKRWRRSI